MVCHILTRFVGPLPSVSTVVARVSLNTGLHLRYDDDRWELQSDHFNAWIGLYELDPADRTYCITVFDLDNYKITYLIDATLFALTDLGGQHDEKLPAWAGQPWELARLLM